MYKIGVVWSFFFILLFDAMTSLGRLPEKDIIASNVREIKDFIKDFSDEKDDVFNVVAPKLLNYIMKWYLDKPSDIKNQEKVESNKAFMSIMLAVSKVDETLFHGLLWCSTHTHNMALVVLYLEAIEKVYWADDIMMIFDSFMKWYPDDIMFRMLYRATQKFFDINEKICE